jgi:hypothetical protein
MAANDAKAEPSDTQAADTRVGTDDDASLYESDRGVPIRLKCVWCSGPMKRVQESKFWGHNPPFRGWAGNDWFCSQFCAASWGVLKCSAGVDAEV